jgi:NAD(P)H-dependent FMN reductase
MSGDLTARNSTVGYFVGSLSAESINRALAKALIWLAPDSAVPALTWWRLSFAYLISAGR